MQPFAQFNQHYENKVTEYHVEKGSGFFKNSRMNHVSLILYQWTFPDWKKTRSEVFQEQLLTKCQTRWIFNDGQVIDLEH